MDTLDIRNEIYSIRITYWRKIRLRYFSGYILSETAQILEIPRGTVVTRQRRALQLLRLELGEGIRK
ncbi:sigma factor-like helix-turn-helix DNA-binding protein [Zhenhengia yiwuensis]|uniref:RNA polymerase sigma-70 region 4 domain-containing protein n=1 Tax=Zhenhengia yiwuensis TaxID=2763666 RepID=A0A926IDS6_9FIRM|nr:hypothetical protein [Zhenhengia yiwuensis]